MNIIRKPCAQENFRDGRQGHGIEAVVIHIVDGGIAGCDATFASSSLTLRRSAHYCVAKSGAIHQYVDEEDTAFHAGRVQDATAKIVLSKPVGNGKFLNPNLYTIGIEHEGRATDEWSDSFYQTSATLLADISDRYPVLNNLDRDNVIMHREIFSGKSCPGFKADVNKLIKLANTLKRQVAVGVAVGGAVTTSTTVRLTSRVRVRREASTTAEVLRILPSGSVLAGCEQIAGEAVSGNSNWYRIAADQFIWAGATDQP